MSDIQNGLMTKINGNMTFKEVIDKYYQKRMNLKVESFIYDIETEEKKPYGTSNWWLNGIDKIVIRVRTDQYEERQKKMPKE